MHSITAWLKKIHVNHRKTFSRSTASSLVATVIDFSSLFCLVEYAHIHYVSATALAAFLGAISNFTINKFWAFEPLDKKLHYQGLQYALVSAGSLVLNTVLVFVFTKFVHFRYLISKVVASLAVGWGWNYPLHRYFVFGQIRR